MIHKKRKPINGSGTLLLITVIIGLEAPAAVTLTESQVQWKTFRHTVQPDFSLLNDTFSSEIVTHTYKSLVMENEYLKVTLVPEFGGRILSMIYKPTGHEQLYQNQVGTPYGPDWDAFYYDWLMLWGGIFPTFPEPEHGKAWCRPWAYEVTRTTAEEVSVAMSFTDDIDFDPPSAQFRYGVTGITCRFEVTLAAGTSALKTSVSLINTQDRDISCEYWTNVGVAPGSVPGNTRCDDRTEIVGPVSRVKIADSWPEIRNAERNVEADLYRFENLRWYKNWADDGIAYAWPLEGNFWGALNHANGEAILRISDNVKTPGLKIWGFGYGRSRGFDPETVTDYHRPFIELWAGASKEFFTPAKFPAGSTLRFEEFYTPVAGLTTFTHASEHAVIHLTTDKAAYDAGSDVSALVSCRYAVMKPADRVTLSLLFRGGNDAVKVHEETRIHDGNGPFEIRKTVEMRELCGIIDSLVFELRSDERTLMRSGIPVTVSNTGSCTSSSLPGADRPMRTRTHGFAPASMKLYTIDGTYIGKTGERRTSTSARSGILVSVDDRGKCIRFVGLHR